MAKGAVHSPGMPLFVLVTHQTDGPTPLRETRLVWSRVAERAVDGMGHLRAMVASHITLMAGETIGGWGVVKGVAPGTDLFAYRSGALVARLAPEPHGYVGLVIEASHLRRERIGGCTAMAEAAVCIRSVVELVATRAGVLTHGHGWTLVAQVATEVHVDMGSVDEATNGNREGVSWDARPSFPVT